MNNNDVEKLKDIGVHVLDIKYSYPDEKFMIRTGFWNHEDFKDEITFSVNGRVESAEQARQIEQALLLLVKAKRSNDPRIMEMLGELETLLNLTEIDETKDDKTNRF